jgi:hypothetical protein
MSPGHTKHGNTTANSYLSTTEMFLVDLCRAVIDPEPETVFDYVEEWK